MDGVDRITHVTENCESCGFKIEVVCVDGKPVLKEILCKACRDAVNVVAIMDARSKWPW